MPGDVLGCHWLFPMPGVNPPRPSSPQPTFIHVTVSYMYELLSTKALRDSSPFSLHMAHNSQSPSFCLLPEGPIPVTFQWCVLTSKAVSNSLQFLPGALKPGSSYFQSRSQSLGFQLSKWAKSRLLWVLGCLPHTTFFLPFQTPVFLDMGCAELLLQP